MKSSRGVTLTETLMAVLVGSILSLAVTRLFTSGIQMTQKGTSHLTNVQNAAILMTQIERDLERTEKILALETKAGGEAQVQFEIISNEGRMNVSYRPAPGNLGYIRAQDKIKGSGGGETVSHTYCKGLQARVSMALTKIDETTGVSVSIFVKTMTGSGEEEILRRFVFCPNLLENRIITTFGWKF